MIPFNKDQQRSFIERTCTLASEKGWKRLFGEIGDLERPRVWPLVFCKFNTSSVHTRLKINNCEIVGLMFQAICMVQVPSVKAMDQPHPADDEVLKLDCVGFSFARTPVFA